jgi:hypothetical protein
MQRIVFLLVAVLACPASVVANGHLTLPFKSQQPLWQGWIYDTGTYHGAIDYGCACGTEILAAHDGWATSYYQPYDPSNPKDYSYGEYVLMYHPSSRTYTLYAHLRNWNPRIPRVKKNLYDGQGWAWFNRGEVIGWAGKTGTQVCHLHFELTTKGYASGRVDPYGLYAMYNMYPGCGNNNATYWFTVCPPSPHNPPASCSNPGQSVDVQKPVDLDGNGKMDFARYYSSVGRWDAGLSTGTSFAPLQQWTCGHGIGSTWQGSGDINGDGRDDSFVFFDQDGYFYVALSSGSGFGGYYKANSTPMMVGVQNKFVGDVNGDGKEDVVAFFNGNWWVALSNGFQLQPQILVRTGYGAGSDRRLVADVNGDRRVDAIAFFRNDGRWYVACGQPNGGFDNYQMWAWGNGAGSDEQFVADVNGDGYGDAVMWWDYFGSQRGVVIVSPSTGWSFAFDGSKRAVGHGVGSNLRLFGDYTGDGKADFAHHYTSAGWYVSRGDGWGFLPPTRW